MWWSWSIAEGRLSETARVRSQELARSYRESGDVLVRKARPRLIQMARKLGLDLSAAKDVAQQTFASLFAKRPTIDDVEGWLIKVLYCRVNDWLRDHGRRNQVCLTTLPDAPVRKLSEEQRLAVAAVLGRLSKQHRRLVEARYFEGHNETDAALLAGLSPVSYKKTMTRALAMMRNELERGCPDTQPSRRKLP